MHLRTPMFLLSGAGLLAGCGVGQVIRNSVTPDTSVRLENDGDFDVEVELYIDDEQDTTEDLLVEIGTRMDFVIPPGETRSFSRNCDDLQAFIVENASLNVIGEIGPQANTDLLRDGDDFNCGDTIIISFTHPDTLTDLDANVSIQ